MTNPLEEGTNVYEELGTFKLFLEREPDYDEPMDAGRTTYRLLLEGETYTSFEISHAQFEEIYGEMIGRTPHVWVVGPYSKPFEIPAHQVEEVEGRFYFDSESDAWTKYQELKLEDAKDRAVKAQAYLAQLLTEAEQRQKESTNGTP